MPAQAGGMVDYDTTPLSASTRPSATACGGRRLLRLFLAVPSPWRALAIPELPPRNCGYGRSPFADHLVPGGLSWCVEMLLQESLIVARQMARRGAWWSFSSWTRCNVRAASSRHTGTRPERASMGRPTGRVAPFPHFSSPCPNAGRNPGRWPWLSPSGIGRFHHALDLGEFTLVRRGETRVE
jgi:hypothetical protein